MQKLLSALVVSLLLVFPALAQKREEAAKPAGIPKGMFFKGQTASQLLAGRHLIGAKVAGRNDQVVGTISDLIVNSDGRIEGVLLGVGGLLGVREKKIGVPLTALKIVKAPGRITISYPSATKERLSEMEAFTTPKAEGSYLASERLVGAKVTNKDGQTIGTVDDLIVSADNRIEGVILGVGGFLGVGEKKIGVQLRALKIAKADGKASVTLPNATKEMLGAVEPFRYPTPAGKK